MLVINYRLTVLNVYYVERSDAHVKIASNIVVLEMPKIGQLVVILLFLSTSFSAARTFRDHFYESWHSVRRICLFTEVKQQWATLVLRWVTEFYTSSGMCLSWNFSLSPDFHKF